MPDRRDRVFMNHATSRMMSRALPKRTSKRPPTTRGSASAPATASRAPSGNRVSAWRNRSASPRLARAPAFIWRARPGAVERRRTPGKRPRMRAVPSRLPPSHDHLRPGPPAGKVGQELMEVVGLVQGGHDDADRGYHPPAVRSAIPAGDDSLARVVAATNRELPAAELGDLAEHLDRPPGRRERVEQLP